MKITEYRRMGIDLDTAMKRIESLDYGMYEFDKKDIHIFYMIENLDWFQMKTNKGLRLIGGYGKSKRFLIYDYKKEQELQDDKMDEFGGL